MTNRERVANFLAIIYSDCDLLSLPVTAPPLSGRATSRGYLRDAARLCELLNVDPETEASALLD